MLVGSPTEVFRAVFKSAIVLCVLHIILYPVVGEIQNDATDICIKHSSCIPREDCLKSKRLETCGDGRFCCEENENNGNIKLRSFNDQKEKNHKNTKSKTINFKRKGTKSNKKGDVKNKVWHTKNRWNINKIMMAEKRKKTIKSQKERNLGNRKRGDKSKKGNNKKDSRGKQKSKLRKGNTSNISSKKGKKKNGIKRKLKFIQNKVNKNDNSVVKRKNQKGSKGSKSKSKFKCTTTTAACKAIGGTCGKKGTCKIKNKGKNKNKTGDVKSVRKYQGKTFLCGLFCECCPPKPSEPCDNKPSTPACDANGGTCMMRSGCEYATGLSIITDTCAGRQQECFECCSPNGCSPKVCTYNGGPGICSVSADPPFTHEVGTQECKGACKCYIQAECIPPKGKCKKINGECIKKGAPCKGFRFPKGCKTKEGCECCAPFSECSPPKGKCKKINGECIKKGATCKGDRFQKGCKRKEGCECCAASEKPLDWQPKLCENLLQNSESILIFKENEIQAEFIPGPPFTAEEIQSALLNTTVPDIPNKLPCRSVFLHNELSNRGVVNPNWPLAEIPYEIHDEFSVDQRQLIIKAKEEIEDKTCIKIVPKEDKHINWMIIQKGKRDSGCYALSVGIDGRKSRNLINLEWDGCSSKGTIMHEILHIAGFDHEQNRMDRDTFVTINWDNILEGDGYTAQFCKVNNIETDDHKYDYESIMHYDAFSFSKDREGKLKTIDAKGNKIGQEERLSQGDIDQINYHYCNIIAQVCTTGWQQIDNKQYCITEHTGLSWYIASAHCQRFGAGVQLAILDTASKRTAVHTYMTDNGIGQAWVGASARSGADFKWLNDALVTDDSWDGNIPTLDGNTCVAAGRRNVAPQTLRTFKCKSVNDEMYTICEQ